MKVRSTVVRLARVGHDVPMAKYLISFPSATMVLAPEDFEAVVESSHAAMREAVLERLARRHALAKLDDVSLAQALADRSRLPREAIAGNGATHPYARQLIAASLEYEGQI